MGLGLNGEVPDRNIDMNQWSIYPWMIRSWSAGIPVKRAITYSKKYSNHYLGGRVTNMVE